MGNIGAIASLKGYPVGEALSRFLSFTSSAKSLKIYQSGAVTAVIPNSNSGVFTANAGTDTLTSASHGIQNGEVLNFGTDGTLPGGIGSYDDDFYYYAINVTTNTFQISETLGGSAIDITSTGSGTHDWYTDVSKVVISSDLEYLTPWILVYNGNSVDGTSRSAVMSDGSLPFNFYDFRIYTDRMELHPDRYFATGVEDLPAGTTLYFTYYQFLDDFTEYTASNTGSSSSQGSQGESYGIRASKVNKDVKECADVDLILSSSFIMSTLQKKGIDTTGEVTHSLGYIPQILPFIKLSGKSFLSMANDYFSVTTTTLDSGFVDASNPMYYLIFKKRTDA